MDIVMGIVGFLVLISAELPVRLGRSIRGRRARIIGCVLMSPFPLSFVLSFLFLRSMAASDLNSAQYYIKLMAPVLMLGALLITLGLIVFTSEKDTVIWGIQAILSKKVMLPSEAAHYLDINEADLKRLIESEKVHIHVKDKSLDFVVDTKDIRVLKARMQAVKSAQKGNFEDAKQVLRAAINEQLGNSELYFLRAKIYIHLNNWDEAEQNLQKTLEYNPDHVHAKDLLEKLHTLRMASSVPKLRTNWELDEFGIQRGPGLTRLIADPLFIFIGFLPILGVAILTLLIWTYLPKPPCNYSPCPEQTRIAQATAEEATYIAATTATTTFQIPFSKTATAYGHIKQTIQSEIATKSRLPSVARTATALDFPKPSGKLLLLLESVPSASPSAAASTGLYMLDSFESAPKLLIANVKPNAWPMAISPDGRQLVVVENSSVALISINGSQEALSVASMDTSSIAWSFDSKQLAFYERESIYVFNLDGTHSRKMIKRIFVGNRVTSLAWSSDGQQLAISGDDNYTYIINIDGSSQYRLFPYFGTDIYASRWSPDGQYIAVAVTQHAAPADTTDIFVGNLLSNQIRQVTLHNVRFNRRGGVFYTWSPDGRFLVYATNGPNLTLEVVDAQGNLMPRQINLITDDKFRYTPVGSPIWLP